MMMIKGKRTKRPRPSDHESTRVATTSSSTTTNTASEEEDQDMAAHCLILLAQGGTKFPKPTQEPPKPITTVTSVGAAYECKTCNRCFPSFQALGGHRASHNKPRLPPPEKAVAVAVAVAPSPSFTVDGDHQEDYFISKGGIKEAEMMGLSLQMACGYNNSSNTLSASNNKPKVHACSICGAEFSSGQALGGHMRRHRPLPSASAGSPPEQTAAPPRNQLCLDLNLPADEQEEVTQSPKFTFGSNDKTLVFAASLVDCRY